MKDEHDIRTKPFNYYGRATVDAASNGASLPACAELLPLPIFAAVDGYFVPVSFVAKDWNVTPRRIRALLAAGRLAGRLQDNGYWVVHYPYLFTLGTRGPTLKRNQKPKKHPRLVVDNTERMKE